MLKSMMKVWCLLKGSAVSHTSNAKKNEIQVIWKAPSNAPPTVQFLWVFLIWFCHSVLKILYWLFSNQYLWLHSNLIMFNLFVFSHQVPQFLPITRHSGSNFLVRSFFRVTRLPLHLNLPLLCLQTLQALLFYLSQYMPKKY